MANRSLKQRGRKKQGRPRETGTPNDPPVRSSPMPAGKKNRSLFWILAGLVAINLVIYAQVRHHGFINWDDPGYVSRNFQVSQGLTWEGFRWAFTTGRQANWHPLTWLSHMLDVQLFGMAAGPHHLINVLFHIANTILLFWVLFRMTAAIGRSAFVAGLFAAHPLHVESVAWISERKDVLCAFFFLLAIWAYIAYSRKVAVHRCLTVTVLFAFALMSKPMAVTLPFILILLDIWPLGRLRAGPGRRADWLRLIREKALLMVLAIMSGVVTILIQWRGGSIVEGDSIAFGSRTANALLSCVAYLQDMVWPAHLSVFYPYGSLPVSRVLLSFLALAGATFMAFRLAGRHPFVLVGWIWYLVTLAPVIGLIQVGSQARADRYTYLPLIGIFIVIAWGIPELLGRLRNFKIPLAIAGGIIIGVSTAFARIQAGHWVNGVILWDRAVQSYPENYLAHLSLGNEYFNRGEDAKAMRHFGEALRLSPNSAEAHNSMGVALVKQGRANEALEHFREAVSLKPNYADARCNLGTRLKDLGEFEEAIAQFTAALKLNPDEPLIYYNMGLALFKQGKNDEAIAHFSEALRLDPGYAEAYYGRGIALSRRGKLDEAIAQYNEALRVKPDFAEARNDWGIALAIRGKFDEAAKQFEEALRIKPDLAEAHNGLANALASQGKPDEALIHYKEAFRIAPDYAEPRRNLGVLLANQGKLDEAVAQYREAIRIKPDLAEAHIGLGDILLFRKQVNEAIVQYREGIRANPDLVVARYNLGIALMMQRRYDEAIVHFTEVLRANPDNAGARGNLGLAYLNKGQEEEAIAHLKEVLRMKPDDKMAGDLLKAATAKQKMKPSAK